MRKKNNTISLMGMVTTPVTWVGEIVNPELRLQVKSFNKEHNLTISKLIFHLVVEYFIHSLQKLTSHTRVDSLLV